jgi:hypothetical protein
LLLVQGQVSAKHLGKKVISQTLKAGIDDAR